MAPPMLRVVEREMRVYRSVWRGTIFMTFLSPVLFLAAMGLGVGDLVDSGGQKVDGFSYLVFVTPGLMVAAAMQAAVMESLWPIIGAMKWFGAFRAIVNTPVAPGELQRGYVFWLGCKAALSASVFLLVAAILGGVPSVWGILAVPATVLTAAAFAAPMTAFSAGQETDFAFPLIMRLGVLPLFLFSGTFFPVSQLPDWLEPLAYLSPLWHGVELARAATTDTFDLINGLGHVAFLTACVVAGFAWGRRTFAQRLAP
jgi:lipooligosaccharide transport system permease protein